MSEILDKASELVSGDRRDDYGPPTLNHGATADMFNGYLARRYGVYTGDDPVVSLDAQDVCVFNICQKLSRLANTPGHKDSLVDIAGYAANIDMLT